MTVVPVVNELPETESTNKLPKILNDFVVES